MKKIIQDNHRIVIHPDNSEARGFYRHFMRPGDDGYNEAMRERCERIKEQIHRHVEGLSLSSDNRTSPGAVEIKFDTREECSFCGAQWEELTADLIKTDPESVEEPGDGPGLPLCCEKAQTEWREANVRTCTHQTGGTFEIPPEYCEDVAEKGSDYCAEHKMFVAGLEALAEKTAACE
jgi:hypothetical protein